MSDTFSVTTKKESGPELIGSVGGIYNLSMESFDFTFTENQAWAQAVTEVYYKAGPDVSYVQLTSSDYELTSSTFKLLIAASSNVDLRTPYITTSESIKFVAPPYADMTERFHRVDGGIYAIKSTIVAHSENASITSQNLNGAKVEVTLSNNLEFIDASLNSSNFRLIDAPPLTTISEISYLTKTTALVTLAQNGTHFDGNISMSIEINQSELNAQVAVVSNTVNIEAVVDITPLELLYNASTPVHGANNASATADIIIKWSKNVLENGGKNITAQSSNSGHSLGFTTGSSAVSLDRTEATLGLESEHLNYGESYFITIDTGAFKDHSDNNSVDTGGDGVWNFTIPSGSGPCGLDCVDNCDNQ